MLKTIVIDTNVLISAAILPASVSAKALWYAVKNFQLVQSEDTWMEFRDVIARKKFDRYLQGEGRQEFIISITRASKFYDLTISITDCPDPKDNKFLELAVSANALLIVSGDVHLLDMNPYRGITIYSPSDFLTFIS
jgi:uncharacterized protein